MRGETQDSGTRRNVCARRKQHEHSAVCRPDTAPPVLDRGTWRANAITSARVMSLHVPRVPRGAYWSSLSLAVCCPNCVKYTIRAAASCMYVRKCTRTTRRRTFRRVYLVVRSSRPVLAGHSTCAATRALPQGPLFQRIVAHGCQPRAGVGQHVGAVGHFTLQTTQAK